MNKYAKAVVAALIAALTALIAAEQGSGVDTTAWLTAAVAFLVSLSAVWAVPNK